MANERTKVKTKDLGLIVGMLVSAEEPENKKVLWYDTSITTGCPIKYYNLTSNTWKVLGT